MAFKLSSDGLNRRPSRPNAAPNTVFNVIMLIAFVIMVLIMLDLWLSDGRYLKYLINDGMRPFRTMFDGLRVKGL